MTMKGVKHNCGKEKYILSIPDHTYRAGKLRMIVCAYLARSLYLVLFYSLRLWLW